LVIDRVQVPQAEEEAMKPHFNLRSRVTGLALAAFAIAALSPAAQAGQGSRRYKGEPAYYPPPAARHVQHAPRVVYVERHSDAAPLLAGLIGGFVIGSVLAQSGPPAHAVAPAYYYWDPWCQERFASLAIYRSHVHHHYHPRVVRVISVESGDCVDTVHWSGGDWRSERGWDHHESCGRNGDWDN
jgi:hypothetical protein